MLTATTLVCALAAGACGWRLYRGKFAGQYPFLLAYFLAQGFILVSSVAVGTDSDVYAYIYFPLDLIALLLCSLVIRTLYSRVFLAYKGISEYAKGCVYLAIGIAVAGAVIGRMAAKEALATKHSFLLGMEETNDSLTFGLAILMVLLFLLLSWFPIKLNQIVLVNGICLGLLLLIDAGAGVVNRLDGLRHTGALNELVVLLDFGCYGVWASLLRPVDRPEVQIRPPRTPDKERELLLQLNGLNEILLRAGKTHTD